MRIAERNRLVVHVTVTTADAELARKLEPRAPRPDLRLAAVRKLRDAGLTAGVLCSPLLPGINDSVAAIDAVAARAAEAQASFLGAHPLFLKSCSRPTWLGFVREHFPELAEDYERRYSTLDFAGPEYCQQMSSRVRQVCRKHGLGERSSDALLTRGIALPVDAAQGRRRYGAIVSPKGKAPVAAAAAQPKAQSRLFA